MPACVIYSTDEPSDEPRLHVTSAIGQERAGAIRLVLWRDSSTSLSYTSGRVQLVTDYRRQWGNICDDSSFGKTEATVICHQLGYTGASSYSRARDIM